MTLKTESLNLTYLNQKCPVLNDINTSFEKNNIYLLLGPSGCGKSSFVNVLSGVIPNNIMGEIRGDVFIEGESILGEKPYELATKIGYVMQDADTQFCTYRVEDELIFGLENLKFTWEEMDKRINRVLDFLKIRDLRYKVLNTLSGGQKQKVAIASILVLDPPIIIFDEPTANLDPVTSKKIFNIINLLKKQLNKTIIIIEHKLDYLIEYVDYVYIFNNRGYIEREGSPKEVFQYMMKQGLNSSVHYPSVIHMWEKLNLPYEDLSFNIDEIAQYIGGQYSYLDKEVNKENNANKDSRNMLTVSKVSYSVEDTRIINNLTFNINKGDFLAILGPNGAGKSTIAGILLNLYKNYQGEVGIEGKSVKKYKRNELWKKAGLVFQNPEWQFVSYNVREELEYSLKGLGMGQEEMKNRIDEYLDRFDLLRFKEANPYLLSQGQKRRLSVATMLITGQDLLILDEPTYGQDYDNQVELLEYIAQLNAYGMTVIMITHDMDAVIKYCNKVLILKNGQSIYFGNNKDLFHDEDLLAEANLLKPFHTEVLGKIDKKVQTYPISLEEFVLQLNKRGSDI